MSALARYAWPGNVRELANVIERAQILTEGNVITADDLPDTLARSAPGRRATTPESPDTLAAAERRHVAAVLSRTGGNKLRAAKVLGIDRKTLYQLIDKYGLEVEQDQTG
jgi:two-component system response regulator AtoC